MLFSIHCTVLRVIQHWGTTQGTKVSVVCVKQYEEDKTIAIWPESRHSSVITEEVTD